MASEAGIWLRNVIGLLAKLDTTAQERRRTWQFDDSHFEITDNPGLDQLEFKLNGAGTVPTLGGANEVLVVNSGGTAAEWASITNDHVDAAAAIAGTKVVPTFGAQNIATTGALQMGSDPATGGSASGIKLSANSGIRVKTNGSSRNLASFASDGARFGDDAATADSYYSVGAAVHSFRVSSQQKFYIDGANVGIEVADAFFTAGVVAPEFYQASEGVLTASNQLGFHAQDNTVSGATAGNFFSRAGNATGGGASVGGNWTARAGNGVTNGELILEDGSGSARAYINASGEFIIDSASQLAAYISSTLQYVMTSTSWLFGSTVSSMTIGQTVAASGAGANWDISSQGTNGTGVSGGSMDIHSGGDGGSGTTIGSGNVAVYCGTVNGGTAGNAYFGVDSAGTAANRAANTYLDGTTTRIQAAGTTRITVSSSNILLGHNVLLAASKDLDCFTNGGFFKPHRVSQSAIPTPDANELMVWRDSDDNKTYIVYNDTDEGVRSVEMV